jgi:hypothetical protein
MIISNGISTFAIDVVAALMFSNTSALHVIADYRQLPKI